MTATSGSFGKSANVAVYNVPFKAGMEAEIVSEYTVGSTTEYAAIGLDTTNVIADITASSVATGTYQTGLLNVYHDNPKSVSNVQYIIPNTGLQKAVLCTGQNNVSPRTVILKRDENGVITGTCNGVTLNFPTNDYITDANEAENLYLFIGGVGTQITWKINYFGDIR